jgi:hypothetical protein
MYIAAAPLALGLLLGIAGFFTFVIAPAAHRILPKEQAAALTRAIFPTYYLSVGVLALGASIGLVAREPYMSKLMLGAALVAFVCRQVLTPRINRTRDAREAGDAAAGKRFARLHRLSMILNFAIMGAAAVATVIHV